MAPDQLAPSTHATDSIGRLGTVLTVWAHPDDEAYLAGALLASLVDAGGRVVCVTATRGEAADPDATAAERAALAELRSRELDAALAVLGVREHQWLDLPDGGCDRVDPAGPVARLVDLLDRVQPDTVVTFGPDGFTGHPDHRAVSRWVDLALAGWSGAAELLHPVQTPDTVGRDRSLDEDFGVYALGRPRVAGPEEVRLSLRLEEALLDRKVAALRRQESQTAGLISAVGLARFRSWVSVEVFAPPPPG